jgi:transposase-like protein
VACFTEDLEGLLAHLQLPAHHRIHCRTTNLIERSFEEERRRTKVIPRFTNERSAMKLVFAVLIRCSERWSRCRSPTSNVTSSDSCAQSSGSTAADAGRKGGAQQQEEDRVMT